MNKAKRFVVPAQSEEFMHARLAELNSQQDIWSRIEVCNLLARLGDYATAIDQCRIVRERVMGGEVNDFDNDSLLRMLTVLLASTIIEEAKAKALALIRDLPSRDPHGQFEQQLQEFEEKLGSLTF